MDYQKEALVTLSDNYYGEDVCTFAVVQTLYKFEDAAAVLDAVKKKLFYNKPMGVLEAPLFDATKYDTTLATCEKTESDFIHALLGILTEAGELATVLRNFIVTGAYDNNNAIEETGDIFWYMALFCETVGTSFDEIQRKNIAKLRARYPNKFTEFDAINRNIDNENEALKNG